MNVRLFSPDEIRCADVVIVGGGIAGMTAALHARDRHVLMVGKTAFSDGGSSVHAQGGIAAAVGKDDSPAEHAADTLRAGAGLCDPETVRRVTAEGPSRITELAALGTKFDRTDDGVLALAKEGGHGCRRVAHAAGDATGLELVRSLAAGVREAPNIEVVDHALALDLLLDGDAVVGVLAVDRAGRHLVFAAPEVVLATGGVGALWERTTNPPESGGDGLAMALRAGAAVADLEFVQFHPTALAVEARRLPLLTEALRGDGAVLVDEHGHRFMPVEHPDAELAPRDVVARAIWSRVRCGSSVFLDATLVRSIRERFPTVTALCREHGFDPAREPLPVTPAAHYHMGGVVVDGEGRTTVPGLWACGEVARTGLHGANRLASNSLLEAVVYGAAVGRGVRRSQRRTLHPVRLRDVALRNPLSIAEHPWREDSGEAGREIEARLRKAMWQGAGLVRDTRGLRAALDVLSALREAAGDVRSETSHEVLAAAAILRAALRRTESRGAHFRSDFPRPADCWRQPLYSLGENDVIPKCVGSVTSAGLGA